MATMASSSSQPVEQVRQLFQTLNVESNATSAGPVVSTQDVSSRNNDSQSRSGNTAGERTMEGVVYYAPNGEVSSGNNDLQSKSGNTAQDRAMEGEVYYAPNGYMIPQGYVYNYASGSWCLPFSGYEDPSRYINAEGIYMENGSMIYHPVGYGYGPQTSYGSYASGISLPAMGSDGQLYGPAAFQYPAHMYQRPLSPSLQYMQAPVARTSSHTPHGRGIRPVNNSGNQYIGSSSGNGRQDSTRMKTTDMKQQSSVSLPVQTSGPGCANQTMVPISQNSRAGAENNPGALGRGYPPLARGTSIDISSGRRVASVGTLEPQGNGRLWVGMDKEKSRGRGIGHFSDENLHMDMLSEQNRGPRTRRMQGPNLSAGYDKTSGETSRGNNILNTGDQYNRSDFVTKYAEAKFFIIKSYSEDDVHKSIKYNVWASTPNGNKRLDAAYQEAHFKISNKQGSCPIFLLYSVNASGQFCGVAEMTGKVDFNKNMEFWQQDKWTGCFPVKWHIIKDVPNTQFRHIIIENNDHKPVTNSRDTQEVKCEQGCEMLGIFKTYAFKTSILDDFDYYENRQRIMQERRARQITQQQQQQLQQQGSIRPGPIETTRIELASRENIGKQKPDDKPNELESKVPVDGSGVSNFAVLSKPPEEKGKSDISLLK